MAEYRLARATAAATFALLVIGGLVYSTGSSLACPDWPLCSGMFFPRMEGGVLFEHGHRLVALLVVALTAALAALVWRRRGAAHRALAALAVLLVLGQALLGAATVIYQLPLLVSAGHLATSMAFFSVVVVLAVTLNPAAPAAPPAGAPWLPTLAAVAVYLQIVLGAFVRHTGSGLACGDDLWRCQGALWPSSGPGALHMAHRLAGVLVAALVAAAAVPAWRAARAARRRDLAALAAAGPALALAQVAAGLWTVATSIAVPVVTLHLALGALLLGAEVWLALAVAGRGAALAAPDAPGLQPAAG